MSRREPIPEEGMPRWVKGFLVVGALLLVLIVAAALTGHGPGRHLGSESVPAVVRSERG
ncbi:hypothetical protein [Actinoplanes flavus]|uniref:Uncharacterized protein n=1 Tax=Actinoplanes flavus TaxID=2820290 RepID=A0ABS3UGX5_9ACTN|nr:hypothetical protein [Actinoplanes flavus]MBO3737696.1 hypothetical protein [Actinoplanes flavus]